MNESLFDPLRLRKNEWYSVERGEEPIQCKSCKYAKVLWIGTSVEPPWEEWGRIVQWMGYPGEGKWRIFWFPADVPRQLPQRGNPITSQHINGGYCYPCSAHTIVIYRIQEATRVLLHELLHAACTDPPGASLPIKEATTETWAEIFLVALCSQGDLKKAKALWKMQSQWIVNQNKRVKEENSVLSSEDYAWRYTVGRELILRSLHIRLPKGRMDSSRSLRLTHPSLCI